MDREARWLREQVARCGPRTRGARVPPPLRAQIAAYARRCRTDGVRGARVAAWIGVSPESIRRWATRRPAVATDHALVAVRVVDDAAAAARLAVVSPTGYRVDGLTLGQAAALLRQLA
jgi:DNA-binding transcriptional regulator YdaS (Cro superfamily)